MQNKTKKTKKDSFCKNGFRLLDSQNSTKRKHCMLYVLRIVVYMYFVFNLLVRMCNADNS